MLELELQLGLIRGFLQNLRVFVETKLHSDAYALLKVLKPKSFINSVMGLTQSILDLGKRSSIHD